MSYNKQDLEAMLASGQIIRTEKLLTILNQNGFLTRRSGGGSSHIFFWHPDYADILADTIVAETENPYYQRIAIRACLQSIELRETVKDIAPELVTQFEETSGSTTYELPDDFEIIKGRKRRTMYLRHKKFPQLATELGVYKKDQDISEWCDYLQKRADKFEAVLKKAVEEYDFDSVTYSNGMITLMHPAHHINAAIPPFSPRLENYRCISLVEDCIAELQLHHEEYADALEKIAYMYEAQYTLDPIKKCRNYTFRDMFAGESELTARLPITKNGYFSEPDFIRFVYAIDTMTWQDCKKQLKRYCGFDVTQGADGRLHGRHALHDLTFSIPDARKLPASDERLQAYYNLSPEDQNSFLKYIASDLEARFEARIAIMEITSQAFDKDLGLIEKFHELKGDRNSVQLLHRPRYGEVQSIAINDKDGRRMMDIRALILASAWASSGNKTPMLHLHDTRLGSVSSQSHSVLIAPAPDELERLEAALAELGAKSCGVDFSLAVSRTDGKLALSLPGLPSSKTKTDIFASTSQTPWMMPSFKK